MTTANMKVEFNDKELEKKLEALLEKIPRDITRDFISTYYSLRAQQHVNDKKYEEIAKLEWLVDLFNLLNG